MTETSELTLLDPYAYVEGCPHARLAELREAGTTSWQPGTFDPSTSQPEILGAWFVHRYEEVKAVLRDPATFSSQRRTALLVDPDPARVEAMSNMLINMDPPKHGQYRRLVAAIFTPRRVEALRPRVEAIAKGVIDRIAPNGTADGINDIAAQLPMRVIAELLGQEIAGEKRGSDDGTVMSAYVNGTLEGVEGDQRGATDEEAGWFLMLMSVGGNETVRTATAQAIRILAEWPD